MPNKSPWVPQGNGKFLPSADLLTRIRANPSAFPNAVDDIARLSGMRREQVEDALWNPSRYTSKFPNDPLANVSRGVWETTAGIGRGLGEAIGIAADKLGIGGDAVRDLTNFNPGFETEQNLHENIGEIVGQAVPSIAASFAAPEAAAAMGLGRIASGAAGLFGGALAATMTYDDEDNLFNTINDMTKR
ncbi:hypothetical protein JP74_04460 [Devosia sp. 17-2-E-8]|nr:hypothetical protein JP74_04460 [Devosia sp. 17-2-E-8]